MLKSTTNSSKAAKQEFPRLPHLFRSRLNGAVVLFTDTQKGTVVVSAPGSVLGRYSEDWHPCTDPIRWTPLKPGESVTITVED